MDVFTGRGEDCDVFVSFSEVDIAFAEKLVLILERAGISHYFYPKNNLKPTSVNFVSEISNALERAKVLICIVSPSSVDSRWIERELIHAINLKLAIFPIRAARFNIPRDFQMLLADLIWREVDNVLLEEHYLVERLKSEIASRNRPEPTSQSVQFPSHLDLPEATGKVSGGIPPYAGPRPFDAHMQDKFFGREAESIELLQKLKGLRVLVVHAPSGAGKSSLLSAKIAPELRRSGVNVFPQEGASGPLRVSGYEQEVMSIEGEPNRFIYSLIRGIAQKTPVEKSTTLAPLLRSLYRPADAKQRVIIIDQFEEIFYAQYDSRYKDRAGFVEALMDALDDDPSLKIILSLRKEFLADIEILLRDARDRFPIDRYSLAPIEFEGARRAITGPAANYLRFEEKALNGLVDQLRQIKVKTPNGGTAYMQGQFIEMAHLQIVCLRLWQSLPDGKSTVTFDDVAGAAGPGRRFDDFVADALNQFYLETVALVAAETDLPEDLILLGFCKFVSPKGTRVMLKSQYGRVGRLPQKVAESLVDHYLLRREDHSNELWYELSHDLLLEPVNSLRDPSTMALLFATDLIDRMLERIALEHGNTLTNYFFEHRDLLEECRRLASHAGLFEEEEELLLRSSIASGIDFALWCTRTGADFPAVRDSVLKEALLSTSPSVRRNAVRTTCDARVPKFYDMIVELAISDPDDQVRKSASLGLSRVDEIGVYARLASALQIPGVERRAVQALATVRMRSAGSDAAAQFPLFFSSLGQSHKNQIRRQSWFLRGREEWPLLLTVFFMASTFAMLVATPYKMIPGGLNWGVSQSDAKLIMGGFQGAVAGLLWAGPITFAVAVFHGVFGNAKRRGSALRPAGAIIFGAIGGLIASVIITFCILGVFKDESLVQMAWISQGATQPIWESFFGTRFAWVNLITGTGLGIGIGLMTNALRSSSKWRTLLEGEMSRIESFAQLWRVFRQIHSLAIRQWWLLCSALLVAAGIALNVPITTGHTGKASKAGLALGLLGDCSTQAIGGLFGVIGMLLATIIIRHGVSIEPSRVRQVAPRVVDINS